MTLKIDGLLQTFSIDNPTISTTLVWVVALRLLVEAGILICDKSILDFVHNISQIETQSSE